MYRTIRFILLVIFTSPLNKSWRVFTGSRAEEIQLVPVGSAGLFGSGKIFIMARPAGLSRLFGILLPGKGSPVNGLTGTGFVWTGPLKSPSFSGAGVTV